ncbi:MAG: 30S ribosomal protein S12 methylthiotransferase RimO [Candidatus Tectomicrobia bacterium]|uniref:Ribosomal protein uS12 methylthiotransferase RimO n=1 Tax=Tectimicrobiota bacterium TaxID=2528274 RepID=A0A937VYV4_UNCTE|nr:30S ribosomal protein S12 methylthiotransferase RimO [Candidatus Tectomicrobia bacterium]
MYAVPSPLVGGGGYFQQEEIGVEGETAAAGKKVALVNLGCAKNLVDAEVMLGKLYEQGYELTLDPTQAHYLIVNTCGFIQSAKEESIEHILAMAELKTQDASKKLVVTGCLAQRYGGELLQSMPEIDVLVGTGDFQHIPEVLVQLHAPLPQREYLSNDVYLYQEHDARIQTTPGHTAYIKIAEGCNHLCTFCIIPKMRGRLKSRHINSILTEARLLGQGGVREAILVAQDSTEYGADIGLRQGLAQLLHRLNTEAVELDWLRVLYLYPSMMRPALLDVYAQGGRLCAYFDMPMQHASDRLLRAMKRGYTQRTLYRLLDDIRQRMPEATIRSTFIVGFPGETPADVEALLAFLERAQLDRVGVFTYSREEGTPSYAMAGQVPAREAARRRREVMALQQEIALRKHQTFVGRQLWALVEEDASDTQAAVGRLASQAPEIDGVVSIVGPVHSGELVLVEITAADAYDFTARVVGPGACEPTCG